MLNATYITYNNILSAEFGLFVGSLDDNGSVVESTLFEYGASTKKSKGMNRFYFEDIDLESAPEIEFSLVSMSVINDITKRDIIAWLTSGHGFQKLIMHKPETEDYYCMCKFIGINEICVNGFCVGFKIKAVLDSPYQYGRDTKAELTAGTYSAQTLKITNLSDFTDKYVYPLVKFKLTSGNSITIVNLSDDENREFKLTGLPTNKDIIIDNELKIITGDGVFLSNFNKNWLRLKKGTNTLSVTLTGSLTITCPQIVCLNLRGD